MTPLAIPPDASQPRFEVQESGREPALFLLAVLPVIDLRGPAFDPGVDRLEGVVVFKLVPSSANTPRRISSSANVLPRAAPRPGRSPPREPVRDVDLSARLRDGLTGIHAAVRRPAWQTRGKRPLIEHPPVGDEDSEKTEKGTLH